MTTRRTRRSACWDGEFRGGHRNARRSLAYGGCGGTKFPRKRLRVSGAHEVRFSALKREACLAQIVKSVIFC